MNSYGTKVLAVKPGELILSGSNDRRPHLRDVPRMLNGVQLVPDMGVASCNVTRSKFVDVLNIHRVEYGDKPKKNIIIEIK